MSRPIPDSGLGNDSGQRPLLETPHGPIGLLYILYKRIKPHPELCAVDAPPRQGGAFDHVRARTVAKGVLGSYE